MVKKILFYLVLLPFSLSLYAQSDKAMVLVFKGEDFPGESASLQFGGTVDATIDWGGGEIEDADTAGTYTHSLTLDNGSYVDTVKISGTLTHFSCDTTGATNYLEKIVSWGNLGLTDLSWACYNCEYLTGVPDSLPQGVTDLSRMFYNAFNFNSDISSWDVSSVTDMSGMFFLCDLSDNDLSSWDVSGVTDMSYMFQLASYFDFIGSWDVSSVTNMEGMFSYANDFNVDLSNWDVSKVTNMTYMFQAVDNVTAGLSSWDVSSVTTMEYMFKSAGYFNEDISNWNVDSVKSMRYMFSGADAFNQEIGGWDVSNVTDMGGMFYSAGSFNADIGSWDVSKVEDMSSMFWGTDSFNADIGSWNVSNVKNMASMFQMAPKFNQDIGNWDVSSVTEMVMMFLAAYSFDVDLSSWDVSNVTSMGRMFGGDSLSTENYSNMLVGWSKLSLQNGVAFNGGDSKYNSAGEEARQKIIDTYGWNISDGGPDSTVTSVDETFEDDGLPTEYALMQNYPNPFNPTTSIEYQVVSSENVSLKVYDMLGREVMTLVNETQSAGNYSVTFNASGLASGVYFYRLTAGDYIAIKKMVLLK